MRLTLLTYHLYLPNCHSLKDKRRVIKGMKERLKSSRFNVSVAEVDHLDLWQRSTLAVAWVSANGSGIDKVAGLVDKAVCQCGEFEVLRTERCIY